MRYCYAPLFCLLLVGCNQNRYVEGLITAKNYVAAHDDLIIMPIMIANGNGGMTTTFIPIWMHEPDRWTLTIEPYDKQGNPLRVTKVLVTQTIYNSVNVGEWFISTPEKVDTRRATKMPQKD